MSNPNMPFSCSPTVVPYEAEPVAVLLSDAEQNEKNQALKSILQKLCHAPVEQPIPLFRTDPISNYQHTPVLSRTESVRTYQPGSLPTDYNGLSNVGGTTALSPSLISALTRSPSVMPTGLFRSPSIVPTSEPMTKE